jgi:hypothetical protein
MTISLAFLAPGLVKAAVEGWLLHGVGVPRLLDAPVSWSRQRQMLRLAQCPMCCSSKTTWSAFPGADGRAFGLRTGRCAAKQWNFHMRECVSLRDMEASAVPIVSL